MTVMQLPLLVVWTAIATPKTQCEPLLMLLLDPLACFLDGGTWDGVHGVLAGMRGDVVVRLLGGGGLLLLLFGCALLMLVCCLFGAADAVPHCHHDGRVTGSGGAIA